MTKPIEKKIHSLHSNWALWMFPILALLICGWLFFDTFKKQGPIIKLSMEDASGLQAEKTKVRFRGVTIGFVKSISISSDTKTAIAKIHLQKEAEVFASVGSKFWIVHLRELQVLKRYLKGLILQPSQVRQTPKSKTNSRYQQIVSPLILLKIRLPIF